MENKPIIKIDLPIDIPTYEEVMNLQERMLPILDRILNYYNMTYNVNMDIVVDNFYSNCCFNTPTKSIVISFLFIFSYFNTAEARRRHVFNNIEELVITVFLHEVKHGIDYLVYRDLYEVYSRLVIKKIDSPEQKSVNKTKGGLTKLKKYGILVIEVEI
jgi:hypothetical protein